MEELTNCCNEQFIGESDICSKCKEHAGVIEVEEEMEEKEQTIGIAGNKQSVLDGLKQLMEEYGGTLTLFELIDRLEHQYE